MPIPGRVIEHGFKHRTHRSKKGKKRYRLAKGGKKELIRKIEKQDKQFNRRKNWEEDFE